MIFKESPSYNQQQIINEKVSTLIPGYNRILIPPLLISKGCILKVIDFNRVLAVNTTTDSKIMSDYLIVSLTSTKLNLTENWRLLANLIIDKKYFLNYFYFEKQYPSFFNQSSMINSIEAKISNTTIKLVREFVLNYGNSYY